jgi:DNA repair protein RadA/Sms
VNAPVPDARGQGQRCIALVGHVTAEGALVGSRVLVTMVDTVLYFEGDIHSSFRLVRARIKTAGATQPRPP